MENQTRRKLILLIDDDRAIGEAVGNFLKESCFDVVAESDPEKAVRLARHLLVDLLILDLQMPKLDGIEVLRLLREKQPHLKVIILTGHMPQYQSRLQQAKIDRILVKPPKTDDLLQAIDELTDTIAFEPEFASSELTPKAKILLVDDEREYCEMVGDFLRAYPKARFDVQTALSGTEGLEKAALFEPDFVLMDWKMPIMQGDEFISRLKAIEGWTPRQILVISSAALSADQIQLLPPDTIHISKPFNPEALCNLLSKRCFDLGLTA